MTFLLPDAPIDPIFSVASEAAKAGSTAINASIGMILDTKGKPLFFDCVRRVTEQVMQESVETGFPYPPLLGVPEFRSAVTRLLFGNCDGVASIAAVGGTDALAINLKLLKLLGIRQVIVPVPTWPNHLQLIAGFDMKAIQVPFLQDGVVNIDRLLESIGESKQPVGILLQASCHNPTGIFWPRELWEEIVSALRGTEHVALLDCAYQGLGRGVEEDVESVKLFRASGLPFLVSWSASKNHGLYGLRTGLACAVAGEEMRELIERHYMILTRQLHSAAPTIGQMIVAKVQSNDHERWRRELDTVREGLQKRREQLSAAFPSWRKSLEGEGLFAMLPLAAEQIQNLRKDNVFFTNDGRVNLAGIPLSRINEMIALIAERSRG